MLLAYYYGDFKANCYVRASEDALSCLRMSISRKLEGACPKAVTPMIVLCQLCWQLPRTQNDQKLIQITASGAEIKLNSLRWRIATTHPVPWSRDLSPWGCLDREHAWRWAASERIRLCCQTLGVEDGENWPVPICGKFVGRRAGRPAM